jgi:large subunit ribosomal protein L25
MQDVKVQAEAREEFGKNASRRLRKKGRIPGVLYGRGMEAMALSVDPKDVVRILTSDTGRNTIFKLTVGSDSRDVLIRDYQLDPLKGNLIHADFHAIAMDEVMVFEVPIELVGVSKGVKEEGGVLDFVLRQVEVECLPADVPDHIRVEVESMEIGDAVRVGNLQVDSSKIKVLSDPDLVVITLVPPHVEKEPEVTLEETEAEPEVIRRGKGEEEEESE